MNKIFRIKDGQDVWVMDEEGVAACLKGYFDDIFRYSRDRDFGSVFSYFEPVITTEENDFLDALIFEKEVKDAMFLLDGLKASRPNGYSSVFF